MWKKIEKNRPDWNDVITEKGIENAKADKIKTAAIIYADCEMCHFPTNTNHTQDGLCPSCVEGMMEE